MDKSKEYWQVEVDNEDARDLDLELFEEMNNHYTEDNIETPKSTGIIKKLVALLTISIFFVFLINTWLQIFHMPSLSFLATSSKLSQDQEIKGLKEAVVKIKTPRGNGTGFNINPEGVIITNYHVIEDANSILVEFSPNKSYKGNLVLEMPQLDLAVIKVEGNNLPVLELASEYEAFVGEDVLIIGNPLGFSKVVKQGEFLGEALVKGIDQPVMMIKGPIHQGSSGSPVFNKEGQVIAVIFATLVQENNIGEPIGLAIPIGLLQKGG